MDRELEKLNSEELGEYLSLIFTPELANKLTSHGLNGKLLSILIQSENRYQRLKDAGLTFREELEFLSVFKEKQPVNQTPKTSTPTRSRLSQIKKNMQHSQMRKQINDKWGEDIPANFGRAEDNEKLEQLLNMLENMTRDEIPALTGLARAERRKMIIAIVREKRKPAKKNTNSNAKKRIPFDKNAETPRPETAATSKTGNGHSCFNPQTVQSEPPQKKRKLGLTRRLPRSPKKGSMTVNNSPSLFKKKKICNTQQEENIRSNPYSQINVEGYKDKTDDDITLSLVSDDPSVHLSRLEEQSNPVADSQPISDFMARHLENLKTMPPNTQEVLHLPPARFDNLETNFGADDMSNKDYRKLALLVCGEMNRSKLNEKKLKYGIKMDRFANVTDGFLEFGKKMLESGCVKLVTLPLVEPNDIICKDLNA